MLKLWQAVQSWEDKLKLYHGKRWVFSMLLMLLFVIRVAMAGGFHVVAYCLAILILNQFLHFLTPLQSDMEDETTDKPVLPVRAPGEFKPFIRKLHEFKLWRNCTVALVVSCALTGFEQCNIPVFWPVLVVYFIALFLVTMRKQIAHMMKHGYIPFDIGKEKRQPRPRMRHADAIEHVLLREKGVQNVLRRARKYFAQTIGRQLD